MLALNISKEVLATLGILNDDLESSIVELESSSKINYDQINSNSDKLDYKIAAEMVGDMQTVSDDFYNFIQVVKDSLINSDENKYLKEVSVNYPEIGKKRANLAYAYKELLARSSVIPFGTDFPVEDISPIMTFYSAVARKDINGYPSEGFQMENSISRVDALNAMTVHGAYANFEEDEKGSIEIGKSADFIILDNDLISIPEIRIPLTNIVATFIDGQLVFNRRYN